MIDLSSTKLKFYTSMHHIHESNNIVVYIYLPLASGLQKMSQKRLFLITPSVLLLKANTVDGSSGLQGVMRRKLRITRCIQNIQIMLDIT